MAGEVAQKECKEKSGRSHLQQTQTAFLTGRAVKCPEELLIDNGERRIWPGKSRKDGLS